MMTGLALLQIFMAWMNLPGSAPMSLDLGLVAHASHAEAIELAVDGRGDGAAERGLAHPRRSHEADDGARDVSLHDTHGEEFEDTLFNVLESVVVPIEHALGFGYVVAVLGEYSPGKDGEPVQVVAGHVELGRGGIDEAELVHLLVDALPGLLGQRELLQALLEAIELRLLALLLQAELLLDLLELLAQEELPLLLGELLLDLLADLGLELGDVDLLLQHHQHLLDAIGDRKGLQYLLQLRWRSGGQGGGHVGQPAGLVHAGAADHQVHLLLEEGIDLNQLLDGADDRQRVGLDAHVGLYLVADLGGDMGLFLDHGLDGEALVDAHQALNGRLRGGLGGLVDQAHHADAVQIPGGPLFRLTPGRILAGADQHQAHVPGV
jgi:hypothetical protein